VVSDDGELNHSRAAKSGDEDARGFTLIYLALRIALVPQAFDSISGWSVEWIALA
jgi:hypothetical protein